MPAFGAAGAAGVAAVEDEVVVGVVEEGLGDALQEAVLDGAGGGAGGEAGAVGDAEDVGVDGDGGVAEGDVEDDAGGLAADAGQGFEGGAVLGNLAAVVVEEGLGEGGDVPGFGLPEADGADVGGDAGGAEGGHGGGGGGGGEEGGGGAVDGGVGGLGGEDDGDEEGEGVGEVELGAGVGVGGAEGFEEGGDLGAGHGGHGGRMRRGWWGYKRAGVDHFGSMERVHFEAVITPYRSLGRRGRRVLVGAILGLSGGLSLGLWLVGAWPAVGADVVEIGLAMWLLRWNAQQEGEVERLELGDGGLRVVRVDVRGRRGEVVLPAGWLRVVVEERAGRVPGLVLAAGRERVEVGQALGDGEKRDLARALAGALERWRRPDFDNPQLREM